MKIKFFKKAFSIATFFQIICCVMLLSSFNVWQTLQGKVVGISDGDTITLLVNGNTQYKIRLLDIDCPEKNQAFGNAAKKHLSDLIFGQHVIINWQKTDRNKRILGTIMIGKMNVNEQMVKDGYAWHFVKYSKDENFHNLEMQARQMGMGLWQDKNAMPPWKFRHRNKNKLQ